MAGVVRQRAACGERGFSLIELMAVVGIIGLLLVIALPIYGEYRMRADRAAAQTFLVEVVSRQEQYANTNREYTASLADLALTVPDDVAANYDIVVTLQTWSASGTSMSGFTVTANPKVGSPQVADGSIGINQFGLRTPVGKW